MKLKIVTEASAFVISSFQSVQADVLKKKRLFKYPQAIFLPFPWNILFLSDCVISLSFAL